LPIGLQNTFKSTVAHAAIKIYFSFKEGSEGILRKSVIFSYFTNFYCSPKYF